MALNSKRIRVLLRASTSGQSGITRIAHMSASFQALERITTWPSGICRVIRSFFAIAGLALLIIPAGSISAAQPADPQLIPQGKRLLDWLSALPSKNENKVVSGQLPYKDYVDVIHDETGQWVGLMGTTVIRGERDPWLSIDSANMQSLIDYWNAGGIVTENFKMHNIKTKGSLKDTNFTDGDLDAAVTPGTQINANLKGWLNVYASFMQVLEDKGIPVLIRPLHEMNCCYFYQNKNPDKIKALWVYIFNYLTKSKGLHNLLFVYSTAAYKHNAPLYYPGNAYVDIVGIDLYKNLAQGEELNAYDFKDYRSMQPYGKPFALTEFGPFRATNLNPDGLRADYRKLMTAIKAYAPRTIYWMSWSVNWSMLSSRNDFVPELLNDTWTINRNEIPNFK